jgi:hypothetical protein
MMGYMTEIHSTFDKTYDLRTLIKDSHSPVLRSNGQDLISSTFVTHYFGHPSDVLQARVQALKMIFSMRKLIGFSLYKTCF